jgi:hypothetical protein
LGCLRRRRRNRQTVFLGGERHPKDYEIRYNGQTVGRGYRLRSTDRELWQWTQIGWRRPARMAGVADSPDEAKAAFRARRGTGYG